MFQIHLSIPCVLVNPKRKLAGHLAVKKSVVQFTGEFLVEGTGGSSVFSRFQDANVPDATRSDQVGGTHKQNLHKGLTNLDPTQGKVHSTDNMEGEALVRNQANKFKRHRWWDISKVHNTYTSISLEYFNSS